ncbi:gdp-fucose transporter 1 [Anaeramoeba ignava]|uniref:Gdp-fucose transporter 1 n=1 Tax=Anaeramoeba ignava TaxID=1746090 RepID=A0A9Q0LLX6_ANAIG|nr:gdp-fucose transporter 1 [Anaeramoeba ignava]
MSDTKRTEDLEKKKTESEYEKNIKMVTMTVSFYFIISMTVVFLNKYLLSNSKFEFNGALFMTWYQLIVSLFCILIISVLRPHYPIFDFMPKLEFEIEKAKKVSIVTVFFIGMVGLNNLCLKYVSVSFYQVARSLTVVFNIVFSKMILGITTSNKILQACGVVIFGFFIGSGGEIDFSLIGTIFGVASSASLSLYSIYVKKYIKILNDDHFLLLIYNTILAIIFLFPIVLLTGEFTLFFNTKLSNPFY